MTSPRDPSLDDCGGCAGVAPATPRPIGNRPGLPAIEYRVATHGEVLRSLVAALSDADNPALAGLRVRAPDDFTIALFDAFACMADVLTFYQERIANESFVRTATERASILELARLLGYELRPGVAASTYLAFRLERGQGSPARAPIPLGTRVQSLPGPGEVPQTFETIEAIAEAVGEWNELPARTTRRPALGSAVTSAYLQGTATNVLVGDALLLVSSDGLHTALRTVRAVKLEAAADRTLITWDSGATGFTAAELHVLHQRAALFGHNAPDWRAMPANIQRAYLGLDDDDPLPSDRTEWPGLTISEISGVAAGNTLHLDAAYPKLAPGSWLVLTGAGNTLARKIQSAAEDARSRFALSSKTTRITLAGTGLAAFELQVRTALVLGHSERLALAELPDASPVERHVDLDRRLTDRPARGRQVLVSGLAQRPGSPAGEVEAVERAVIKEVIDDPTGSIPTSRLVFETELVERYRRETVRVHGNIALATHGETAPPEPLGSGDARQTFQRFTVKSAPVTYTPAPVAEGGASTLSVRVDGVEWSEVPSLLGRRPDERVYISRRADDGRTSVLFGDGKSGARLPSGRENVTARLRKGLGAAGNLPAGRLTLLPARPLGVKEVTNPGPAEGGQDAQRLADARDNAPRSVITLERVVSLRDHEDFARNFSGIAKAQASITVTGETLGVLLTIAGPGGAAISAGSRTRSDLLDAIASAGDRAIPVDARSYRPAWFRLRGGIAVQRDRDPATVIAEVLATLRARFSFEQRALGQAVAGSEVIAAIQGVAGVVMVDLDELAREDGAAVAGRPGLLPADAPAPYSDAATALPAELLLLRDGAATFRVIS